MGRTSDANERLMDAAMALIWEQSYGAVTIDDICRRAAVKKGSFYYFFESKSDLAVHALERHWLGQKPILDDLFAPANAPLERIRAYCEDTYRCQLEARAKTGHVLGCPLCCLGSEISTQDPLIRDKIRDILARRARYWESAIRDAQSDGALPDGDVARKARCVIAYYEGLTAQARLHNNPELLRELPRLVFEHLQVRPVTSVTA